MAIFLSPGGGTPGGSTGQLQQNLSGAFAGVGTSSIDGSGNMTFSGRWIQSGGLVVTGANGFDLYGNYTSDTNFERLSLRAQAGSNFVISSEAAGTGTTRGIQFAFKQGENTINGFRFSTTYDTYGGHTSRMFLGANEATGQGWIIESALGQTLNLIYQGQTRIAIVPVYGNPLYNIELVPSSDTSFGYANNATVKRTLTFTGGNSTGAVNGNDVNLTAGNAHTASGTSRDGGTLSLFGGRPKGAGAAGSIVFNINNTECARINASGDLVLASGTDLQLSTTTGTKIGTETTQLLGFWNAIPAPQPAAVANATDAASVITQLNALLSRLRSTGLIAT